jgi:hypothetical protein
MITLLRGLATSPNAKTRTAAVQEIVELLRSYPKWRFQSLVLQELSRAYVSLRGNLSDQLREINFCRVRLGELLHVFSEEGPVEGSPSPEGRPGPGSPVRHLFPVGSRTLEEAVEHTLEAVSPAEFQELDQQVQAMIRQQFRALVHVCMSSANVLKNVHAAMEQEVGSKVELRVGPADVAGLFLEQYPNEEEAMNELLTAFDEAAPDLTGTKSGQSRTELCILSIPHGPAGERVQALATQALPEVAWTIARGAEDIVFYREASHLPIAELEQLGSAAQEAYRQMSAVEHLTPHSRIDITFRPVSVI